MFYFSNLFLTKSFNSNYLAMPFLDFNSSIYISKKFLRKVLKTKCNYNNFKTVTIYPNIHKVIFIIKSWDKNVKFFVVPKILIYFKKINKNILRNIFLSKIKDYSIWNEIEKMINANVFSISNHLLHNSLVSLNNLSLFLLNLYLSQLDLYIKSLYHLANFNKFLCLKPYFLKSFYQRNLCILKNFIPLKIYNYIRVFFDLKKIRLLKQTNLSHFYKKISSQLVFSIFFRHIYFVRYNENIALGIIGSKSFSKFIIRKLKGFIRSNLHFDFFEYDLQYFLMESLFFLGFKIQLFNLNFKKDHINFNKKITQKYLLRINARIVSWKKKLSSLIFNRFSYEFFGQVISILNYKKLNFSVLKDRKLWLYLFQVESIRCFQINKLINSNDKINLISEESFKNLKFFNFTTYQNFSFNFYIKKIRILLKNVLNTFSYFISKSVIPIDQELLVFFSEYNKKLSFFNDTFYYTLFSSNSLKVKSFYKFLEFRTCKNLPKAKNRFLLENVFFTLKNKNLKVNSYFLINCPIAYMLLKFSGLGFIDLKKKRPIGNIKFLNYEDKEIIKYFGSYSYSLINWFHCSDNFSKVKFLVEVIRQSCFLTLCRKHNKRKTWVYSVYTPNLLINPTIFENKSFFPTKKLVITLQKFFLFNQIDFIYSANFLII